MAESGTVRKKNKLSALNINLPLVGKAVRYQDLSPADFKAALLRAGLTSELAALLYDSDAGASQGALFDDGKQLSLHIGRPMTPLVALIAAVLPRQ